MPTPQGPRRLSSEEIDSIASEVVSSSPYDPVPMTRLEPEDKPWRSEGALGDLGVSVAQGALRLPSAVTGLADIPVIAATGRPMVTEGWDALGELTGFQPSKAAQALESRKSEEYQRQRQTVDTAFDEGLGQGALAVATNPRYLMGIVGESAPQMVAGGALARSLPKTMGVFTRAGVGEGTVMAGQTTGSLLDQGADPTSAALAGVGVGVAGGTIGGLGGRYAARMGFGDVETAIAGNAAARAAAEAAEAPVRGFFTRVAGTAGLEGAQEIPQEGIQRMAENLALGKPITEGVGRSVIEGFFAGAGTGAAVAPFTGRRAPAPVLEDETPPTGDLPTGEPPTDAPSGPTGSSPAAPPIDTGPTPDQQRETLINAGLRASRVAAKFDTVGKLLDTIEQAQPGGNFEGIAEMFRDAMKTKKRDRGEANALVELAGAAAVDPDGFRERVEAAPGFFSQALPGSIPTKLSRLSKVVEDQLAERPEVASLLPDGFLDDFYGWRADKGLRADQVLTAALTFDQALNEYREGKRIDAAKPTDLTATASAEPQAVEPTLEPEAPVQPAEPQGPPAPVITEQRFLDRLREVGGQFGQNMTPEMERLVKNGTLKPDGKPLPKYSLEALNRRLALLRLRLGLDKDGFQVRSPMSSVQIAELAKQGTDPDAATIVVRSKGKYRPMTATAIRKDLQRLGFAEPALAEAAPTVGQFTAPSPEPGAAEEVTYGEAGAPDVDPVPEDADVEVADSDLSSAAGMNVSKDIKGGVVLDDLPRTGADTILSEVALEIADAQETGDLTDAEAASLRSTLETGVAQVTGTGAGAKKRATALRDTLRTAILERANQKIVEAAGQALQRQAMTQEEYNTLVATLPSMTGLTEEKGADLTKAKGVIGKLAKDAKAARLGKVPMKKILEFQQKAVSRFVEQPAEVLPERDAPVTTVSEDYLAAEAEQRAAAAKRLQDEMQARVMTWLRSGNTERKLARAAADWNERAGADGPQFASLTPAQRLEWLDAVAAVYNENVPEEELVDSFRDLLANHREASNEEVTPTQPAGTDGGTGQAAPETPGAGATTQPQPEEAGGPAGSGVQGEVAAIQPEPEPAVEPEPQPKAKPKIVTKGRRKVTKPKPVVPPTPEEKAAKEPAEPELAPVDPDPRAWTPPKGAVIGEVPDNGEPIHAIAKTFSYARPVYHNPATGAGLVEGYSSAAGKTLYAPVVGDTYRGESIFVAAPDGTFTPDILAELRDAANSLQEQEAQAGVRGPFLEGDQFATTASVPTEILRWFSGLVDQLGMGSKFFLATSADLEQQDARQRYNLYGPYSTAVSSGVSEETGVRGGLKKLRNGVFVLTYRADMAPEEQLETIAHELGHALEEEAYAAAPAETRQAIEEEFTAWQGKVRSGTRGEMVDSTRSYYTAQATKSLASKEVLGSSVESLRQISPSKYYYWTGFSEYFADQVAKWAMSSEKPRTLVDQFFKDLGAKLRKLYAALHKTATGRQYLPQPKFAEYLNSRPARTWAPDTGGTDSSSLMRAYVPEELEKHSTADLGAAPSVSTSAAVQSWNRLVQPMLEQLPPNVRSALKATKRLTRKAVDSAMFTHQVVERAKPFFGDTVVRWWDAVRQRAVEKNQILSQMQEIVDPADTLEPAVRKQVEKFLNKSTKEGKWGFQPDWDAEAEVDPLMEAEFNNIPSQQARNLIINMFRFGHRIRDTLLQEMQAELDVAHNKVLTNLQRRIADMQNQLTSLPPKSPKRKVLQERIQAAYDLMARENDQYADKVERFEARKKVARDPYMPLRRWGKIVVVGTSEEYRQVQAQTKSLDPDEAKEARARLREIESDPMHRRVSFTDSVIEADAMKADWLEAGLDDADWSERMTYFTENEAIPFSMIQRLKKQVEGLDSKESAALEEATNRLYVQILEDTSIRKTELYRKNIAGESDQMLRAFVENIQGSAHLLAAMRTNRDTFDLMADMKNLAKSKTAPGTRDDRMLVLNQLLARQEQWLTYRDGWFDRFQSSAMGHTSVWMLLSTPSYYLQNMTQVAMLTWPSIGARFGLGKSASALTQAYKDVAAARAATPGRKAFSGHLFDITKIADTNERVVLQYLQDRGLLDVGIEPDLGKFERAGTQAGQAYQKGVNALRHAVRTVELYNRATSALAAYRLYMSQPGAENSPQGRERGRQYALQVIEATQGDYSHINAPQFIESMPAGRMMFQFRKFQIIQLALLGRTMREAVAGADSDTRSVARKQFSYFMMTHGAVGGLLGLPAMNLIGPLMASIFGDEDEPKDIELMIRRSVKDKALADLLIQGVPSFLGVDLQARLSMSTTTSLFPFADFDLSRGGYQETVLAALGPAAALGGQFVDGMGLIADGEVVMGTAQLMPRMVRDTLRAYVQRTDGVRNRSDEQLLSPEDISLFDTLSQIIGAPSKRLTDRWKIGQLAETANTHFSEKSVDIKKQYIEARQENDLRATRDAQKAWRELQAARVAYGMPRQKMSELTSAYKRRRNAEANAVEGVATTKATRALVQELFR